MVEELVLLSSISKSARRPRSKTSKYAMAKQTKRAARTVASEKAKKNEEASDETEEQETGGDDADVQLHETRSTATGTPAKRKKGKGNEGRDQGRDRRGGGGSGGGSAKKMKIMDLPFPLTDTKLKAMVVATTDKAMLAPMLKDDRDWDRKGLLVYEQFYARSLDLVPVQATPAFLSQVAPFKITNKQARTQEGGEGKTVTTQKAAKDAFWIGWLHFCSFSLTKMKLLLVLGMGWQDRTQTNEWKKQLRDSSFEALAAVFPQSVDLYSAARFSSGQTHPTLQQVRSHITAEMTEKCHHHFTLRSVMDAGGGKRNGMTENNEATTSLRASPTLFARFAIMVIFTCSGDNLSKVIARAQRIASREATFGELHLPITMQLIVFVLQTKRSPPTEKHSRGLSSTSRGGICTPRPRPRRPATIPRSTFTAAPTCGR